MQNKLKNSTRLALITALLFTSMISKAAPVDVCQPADSVQIDIEDFKFIQTWAEFGLTCEKTTAKLTDQIERDRITIETLDKELIDQRGKNDRLRTICGVLGSSLGVCIVWLFLSP